MIAGTPLYAVRPLSGGSPAKVSGGAPNYSKRLEVEGIDRTSHHGVNTTYQSAAQPLLAWADGNLLGRISEPRTRFLQSRR